MAKKPIPTDLSTLPACAGEFIRSLIRKMRHRRSAREEVQAELAAHFEDELRTCTDPQEREQKARRLLEEFGDVEMLAVLCRRAKKRCRPLWAKMLVRTAQGFGVFLLLSGLYVVWFISGKPNAKVDYLAVLNQMSRPEVVEQDNAWPHLQRACALLTERPEEAPDLVLAGKSHPEYREIANLSEPEQKAVAAWVEANRPAWEEFQAAGAKPYCCRPYEYAPGQQGPWLLSVVLPHLTPLRTLAAVGTWRCRLEAQRGQIAAALQECLTIARVGRHWQRSGLLIEELVGLALSRIAHEEIVHIVSHHSLSAADLADVQCQVAALYPGSYPLMSIEGEHIAFMDTVQHVFTDGGPGGGHMIADVSKWLSVTGGESPEPLETALWTGATFVHAGRERTLAKAREYFDLAGQRAKLTPWELRNSQLPTADQVLQSLPRYRYMLLYYLAPAVNRASELAFRGRALHEVTVTILALQRYQRAKGAYPATLDELKSAGYLDALPRDPYGQGPLVYKVTGDTFLLHSLGPNFCDDGGRPGQDRKGKSELWADNGDAVFWPAP